MLSGCRVKKLDDVDQDEVAERDVAAEKEHRDETIIVESISSLYLLIPFSFGSQGQDAFCSSTLTSLMKFRIFVIMGICFERVRQQPGQEGLEPPTGGFGDRCSTN